MSKKIYIIVLTIILTSFVFTTSNVYSYGNGRASCTLKPGSSNNGCSCHGSSNSAVLVSVTGPATLMPGETGTYTFSVSRSSGTFSTGGVDIAVSSGTLALASGSTGLKILSGELVNSSKFTSATTKTFTLTAPTTPGQITIYCTAAAGTGTPPWNHGTSFIVNVISGINQTEEVVHSYSLSQNFPNPFNPTTNISFGIPKSGLVNISVYDITGKFVTELVNSNLSAGKYNTAWDASSLSSGVYYYKIQAGDFIEVKKMSLIK